MTYAEQCRATTTFDGKATRLPGTYRSNAMLTHVARIVADRPKAGGRRPQVESVNRAFEIQLSSMDMPRYGFVLLAALLGIAGLVASYCRAQSSLTEHKTKHSKWDYLLVWPLILKRGSTPRSSKILSAREFIGWGVVIILIVAAVVFRW
jgi:hypothetical protein